MERDELYETIDSNARTIIKLTERNNKLKGWHKDLMHHAMKLEDQNEEMLVALKECRDCKEDERMGVEYLNKIIQKIEGE